MNKKEDRDRLLNIIGSEKSVICEAFEKMMSMNASVGERKATEQERKTIKQIFSSGFASCFAMYIQSPNILDDNEVLLLLEKMKIDVYKWIESR